MYHAIIHPIQAKKHLTVRSYTVKQCQIFYRFGRSDICLLTVMAAVSNNFVKKQAYFFNKMCLLEPVKHRSG
jgi:hypothetical protein